MNTNVVVVPLDEDKGGKFRSSGFASQPNSVLPEKDKTPDWYYKNLRYFLSYYNAPIGRISYGAATNNDRSASDIPAADRFLPVQKMLRMVMYYMGEQPNLDYSWLTQNVSSGSLEARWIKGNNVSEFVNYFRGLIIQQLSNAHFSAEAVCKESTTKKKELIDKLYLKMVLKPVFDAMAEQTGVSFNPAPNANPELLEDIENEISKTFNDKNTVTYTDLTNGIYFENGWSSKLLQQFMHVIITGGCFFEHYVEQGRSLQKTLMPWQMVVDTRVDDDYGRMDMFRGKIEQMTVAEISNRYPQLSYEQLLDIQNICKDKVLQQPYIASTSNILWWGSSTQVQNTVSVVTMYWRGARDTERKVQRNAFGAEIVKKVDVKKGERGDEMEDIHVCTLIGDKYIVEHGYIDNVVSNTFDRNRPLFPISRFQPNTFFGKNISEVSRVHKIQDEMDMLDFKIREMIGKAKGRVYFIYGDKLPEGLNNKEFFENLSSMGVQVTHTSGTDDNSNAKDTVQQLDWTLDPNIYRLAELYKEREERMGKILSTSPLALGQSAQYTGMGVQQKAIAQNTMGVSYLLDGFLDYVVMNMAYAANQQKLLSTIPDTEDLKMMLGDKGVKWLEFTKEMQFEQMFVKLKINDTIDDAQKASLQQLAQALMQNQALDLSTYIQISKAKSLTQMQEILEAAERKKKKEMAAAQQQQASLQQEGQQQQQLMLAEIENFKQSQENFRKEMDVFAKMNGQMATFWQQMAAVQPPPLGGQPPQGQPSPEQMQQEQMQQQEQQPIQ